MGSFMEHFRDGGWGMFPTLACGLVMLGVAVKYAQAPEKRLVPLMGGLGILTLATGALGFVSGLITTCGAAGQDRVPLGQDTHLAIIGFGESLNNLAFALVFVVLAAFSASLGALRIART